MNIGSAEAMPMKTNIRPNPDLRAPGDPDLGVLAPIRTQFFYAVRVGSSPLHGQGVFAEERIARGAVVAIGGGQVTSSLAKVPHDRDYIGILDERYVIGPLDYDHPEPNWLINHRCDANLKLIGRLVLVTRRDISPGEELSLDYTPIAAGPHPWSMQCHCGAPSCRGMITNEDWREEELFLRFFEELPAYLQKRG